MAWAIISDIHGNLQSLEAVLAEMPNLEGVICLGDVVGYGADPEECCRRVRELKPLVLLKGNHEAGVLGELPLSWLSRHALLALIWTRAALSEEGLDFLSSFSLQAILEEKMLPRRENPHQPTRCPSAGDILFLHGSLADPFDYVDSTWKAEEIFRETDATLCFLGHTHIAGWFSLDKGQEHCRWTACPTGGLLTLEKGTRYVINCGSVGQPRDGNPQAAFGLFDPAHATVEFRRVEYDIMAAQERICRAGLPDVLAERLAYGL